jgi:hypothetical protein
MICPPCKQAGDYNSDAERTTDEQVAKVSRFRALELHGQCSYPETCGCQHKVGDWRNRRTDG